MLNSGVFETFTGLTVNAGGSVSFSSSFTLSGSLTINGGTILKNGGGISVAGDITFNGGGTISGNPSAGTIFPAANVVVNGSANPAVIQDAAIGLGSNPNFMIADCAAAENIIIHAAVLTGNLTKLARQAAVRSREHREFDRPVCQQRHGGIGPRRRLAANAWIVTVGDGLGIDAFEYAANDQLRFGELTVNSSGLVHMNGFNDGISDLQLNAGQVTTGAGVLTVYSLLKSNAATKLRSSAAI